MDSRIQSVGAVATEAFKELKKIQTGESPLVKTGEEMIDCHIGGLLPGDVVTLAGAPSSGKSETLYRMLSKMMDVSVNKNAMNFVSLEYSFEMKILNKLVRKAHNLLNKKKSAIISETFTEEEKPIIKAYAESLKDDRRYVCQSPITSEEFYTITKQFCIEHKDKEAILISIDHLLLFAGSDKQLLLEKVCEAINLLKIEFTNVYFFPLSQLNRTSTLLPKDKDNSMMPNNSMLFGSSFIEHLSSYIVIITNPFLSGISQYLKVSVNRFPWLEDFYGEIDNKGRVSFKTLGNLFYFVTKMRESDNSFKNLFVRTMDLSEDQRKRMEAAVVESNDTPAPVSAPPVFDMTNFNTSAISNAQGGDFDEAPF